MEVGKGQHQENFSRNLQCSDIDDEDEEDGHFVIALDDTDQENDELDGIATGNIDLTRDDDFEAVPSIDSNRTGVGTEQGGDRCESNSKSIMRNDSGSVVSGLNDNSNMSAMNSLESPPVTLSLECTTDDEHNRNDEKVTGGNDSANMAPSMPNFLISSPDIIKRLKSTLMDRSSVSQDAPHSTSCSGNAMGQEKRNDGRTMTTASRKLQLDFVAQDDCTCIMCPGWVPSQYVDTCPAVNVPSSIQSTQEVSKDFSTVPLLQSCQALTDQQVLKDCSSVSTQNVLSMSHTGTNVVSNLNMGTKDKLASLTNQTPDYSPHQIYHPHLPKSSNSDSVAIPRVQQHAQQSSSAVPLQRISKSLAMSRKENLVVIQNGSYYVIYPYALSTNPGVRILKKIIPEIDTSGVKTLLLTKDFVTQYRPDIKALVMKTKKVDFTIPGTVLMDMSNEESTSKIDCVIPPHRFSVARLGSENNKADDNLDKMIHAHFKSQLGLSFNTRKVKDNTVVLDMPSKSAPIASQSTDMKVPLLTCAMNPEAIVLPKAQLHSFSKLPPPPPLTRRPGGPSASQKNCNDALIVESSSFTVSQCAPPIDTSVPMDLSIDSNPASSHNSHTTYIHSVPTPSLTSDSEVNASSSESQSCSTSATPVLEQILASPSAADHKHIEEPREIFVIPVVDKHQSNDGYKANAPIANKLELSNSENFTESPESLPVKSAGLSQKAKQDNRSSSIVSHTESQKLSNQSSLLSVKNNTSLENEFPVSSKAFNVREPSQFLSRSQAEPVKPLDTLSDICVSHQPASDSSFPSVVTVNLSSSANVIYSETSATLSAPHCHAVSTSVSYSMLPTPVRVLAASNPSSSTEETFSHSKAMFIPSTSCTQSTPSTQYSPIKSFQKHIPAIMASSSSRRKQSFHRIPSSTKDCVFSYPQSFTNVMNKKTSSSPFYSSATATQTKSLFLSSSQSSSSQLNLVSTATPITSTQISSSGSSSSSSVSVNGLKLKIRLGDAKSSYTVGEDRSEKCKNNTDTPPIKWTILDDQDDESVKKNNSPTRIETAEEKFQRYQEQAMKEVYNAQFGVGNVSRSLRRSRANISFVDRPLCRLDNNKKKKTEESGGINKSLDDVKNETLQKTKETLSNSSKVNKKRRDSGTEQMEPEPELDINDFPRLREDTSTIMTETISTPNILVGHKVFVKFNVFSNLQSGRSFLIPFFNLGGSRRQFDVEDMEYIKKSVIDAEKDQKFCARHLIYHSREGRKASFLRKENLAYTTDLSESSYKQHCYILQGFTRESELTKKKVAPVPDEWKVDKKVSIEIDTADVDSNVVIDFEDSLANATVSKNDGENDTSNNSDHNIGNAKCNMLKRNHKEMLTSIHSEYNDDYQMKSGPRHVDHMQKHNVHISSTENDHSTCNEHIGNENSAHITKPSINQSCNLNTDSSLAESNHCPYLTQPTTINPPVSEDNYTNQLKKLLSSSNSILPPMNHSVSKATVVTTSTNYTDQLKKLFLCGDLHDTYPCASNSTHLGEGNHQSNYKDQQLLPQSNSKISGSPVFPCASIKEEIIDEEYMQSSFPPLQTCQNSSPLETCDTSSLSATGVRVKPEPIDLDFDSLEADGGKQSSTKHMENDNQLFRSVSELSASSNNPVETDDVRTASGQNELPEISENMKQAEWEAEEDEETMSAFSKSPPPSSSVSESSEVSSSSCVDTTDDDDSSEDGDVHNALTASSLSFTCNISESAELLDANLPQNPCKTKITSLVESLKQRLSQNTTPVLPSVFPEPTMKPTLKVKKKKVTRKRKRMHSHLSNKDFIENLPHDESTIIVKTHNNTAADIVTNPPLPTSLPTTISSSLGNATSLSASSDSKTASSILLPQKQFQSEPDLALFRKRFPFITSSDKPEAKNSESVDELSTHLPIIPNRDQKENVDKSQMPTCNPSTASASPSSVSGKHYSFPECTPCDDDNFDSESDIDVGVEEVYRNNTDNNTSLSRDQGFLSTSHPFNNERGHHRDFTRNDEFVTFRYNENNQEGSIDGHSTSKPFVIPIRPRNRIKTLKPKPPAPKDTAPLSTASLLCEKLDISVESMTSKLKGKLMTTIDHEMNVEVQCSKLERAVASQDHVPKPINPAFKPSINAIFGVPDIPKSLETIVTKPGLTIKSVAKKSSSKNAPKPITKQVARKRTMSNLKSSNDVKQQKTNESGVNETQTSIVPEPNDHNNQLQTALNSKSQHRKQQKRNKDDVCKVKQSNTTKPQQTKNFLGKKKMGEALDSNSKSLQVKLNKLRKSEVAGKDVGKKSKQGIAGKSNNQSKLVVANKKMDTKDKSGVVTKAPNKGSLGATSKKCNQSKAVAKKTLASKSKVNAAKKTLNNKNKQGVTNKTIKNKNAGVEDEKLSINSKGPINRKLGTLLIEVNRYSSLRKFAWRKYSNFKERAFIVETGAEDNVREIMDCELREELAKQKANNTKSDKEMMDDYGIKPCELFLYRLEDMQWDSKEIPVQMESGTYIIQHSQEPEKRSRVAEVMKKRKKKSVIQRTKKGGAKPRGAKKDIVDYYAAAIESLRKKALLLEEDEKKKAEKIDGVVIKQVIVEFPESSENGDGELNDIEASSQCTGINETCDKQINDDSNSEHIPHSDTIDTQVSKNNENTFQSEKDNESNENHDSIFTFPENAINTPEKDIHSDKPMQIDNEIANVLSSVVTVGQRKCVKLAERNYEGESIQKLIISFQDPSDVDDEMGDGDVDSVPDTNITDLQPTLKVNLDIKSSLKNEGAQQGRTSPVHEDDYLLSINTNTTDQKEKNNVEQTESQENVEKSPPSSEEHSTTNISQNSFGDFDMIDTENSVDKVVENDGVDNGTTNISHEVCDEKIDRIVYDKNNDKIVAMSDIEEKDDENSAIPNDSAMHVFNECNQNALAEMSVPSDFVPKDIILGFEDELGTDTVLSKLPAEGEDEMFLLGDGDDDVETIGLIPDEEVERLLGLDVKEGEQNLSVGKQQEDKTNEGDVDSNIDGGKLSWTMLPESVNKVDQFEKITIPGPGISDVLKRKTEGKELNSLTIDTNSESTLDRSDISPERSTLSADGKAAKISPSWKRILGSQALKEIEESVTSTIATSSNSNSKESSKTPLKTVENFKPTLQTDMLKLKLCTGALSKALKLSAEMRKTFGDNGNDHYKKECYRATSQTECKKKREDGESCFNISNPATTLPTNVDDLGDKNFLDVSAQGKTEIEDESTMVESVKHQNHKTVGTNESIHNRLQNHTKEQAQRATVKSSLHPLGKNKIDLTKLKMKLTPILASAKAKSAVNDGRSPNDQEGSIKPQNSVPVLASEVTQKGTLPSKVQPVSDPSDKKKVTPVFNTEKLTNLLKDVAPNLSEKKKLTPVLNTEKLTNLLKNFKKPLNLNLPSKSPKAFNTASSSSTSGNSSESKIQHSPEQKLPIRKRTRSNHQDVPIQTKKSKLATVGCSSQLAENEALKDAEERSCFDCLSELKSSQ